MGDRKTFGKFGETAPFSGLKGWNWKELEVSTSPDNDREGAMWCLVLKQKHVLAYQFML